MTVIPPLTTVECPVCHHQVGLGLSGELVPFHWLRPIRAGQRRPCPGQGAVVTVTGSGLVASMPAEPEEVATP